MKERRRRPYCISYVVVLTKIKGEPTYIQGVIAYVTNLMSCQDTHTKLRGKRQKSKTAL